jgi:O-antigen ligase
MAESSRLSQAAPQAAVLTLAACFGVLAGIDPKFAVAGAIGVVFLGATLVNLTFGLGLFTLVAFVDVLPDPGGSLFSFAKIAGALLATSWLATLAVRRQRTRGFVSNHPYASYAILLFLVWGALGVLWAEEPGNVPGTLQRYALNLILFLIVYTAVGDRRQVLYIVGAYLAGTALAASVAIAAPRGWSGTGNDVARATGTIGDANELAAALIPGFIMSLVLMVVLKRSPLARLVAAVIALLCIVAIFFTVSRGGLIGLGAALLAAIVVGGRWRAAVVACAVGIALVTVGYFAFVASPQERARVTETQGGTGRTDIWTVGMRMVHAHPLTGIGLGNFQNTSVHYLIQAGEIRRSDLIIDRPKVAHNTFLQVLAELGIPGLLLFLGIVAFSLTSALRAAWAFSRSGDLRMELIARGLPVSLCGLLAADFFLSANYSKQLWLLLGLCPALLAMSRKEPSPVALEEPPAQQRWSEAPALV